MQYTTDNIFSKSHFFKISLKKIFVKYLSIILCIFHIYTGLFGVLISPQQRGVHVGLSLSIVFLTVSFTKKYKDNSIINILNIILVFISIISGMYVFLNYNRFLPLMIIPPDIYESALAILTTIAILEAGRRMTGWVFPTLTFIILLYSFFGHYIPGKFGHAYFRVVTILKSLYFSADGIWGFVTGLSSTYVALFIIFGSFLLSCGGGATFFDIALLLTGKFKGGPAKVAVLASGFFGMISGSGVSNVATTGNLTIPLMKKMGYSSEFSASVEAVASSGGVIMPPIMGAAAFIMAEFLNLPYRVIAISAIIPAFLFFLSVFLGVHYRAIKLNLKPVPRDILPSSKEIFVFSKMFVLFLPIIVLLYLLFKGFSLNHAASFGCISVLLSYIFSSFSLQEIKRKVFSILHILEEGGERLATIVPVLVCANIVLGLLNFTGLSIKFSQVIISIGGGSNIIISLVMTAILVMILGCGITITGAYVIAVSVAAPILAKLGIMPLASHFFIFYYACLSQITPPVCTAIFVASSIAKSNWLKTSIFAMLLSQVIYILPFVIIFNNAYIMIGTPIYIIFIFIKAILGVIFLEAGLMRQFIFECKKYEFILLVAAGALLLITQNLKDSLIVLVFLIPILIRKMFFKKL